MARPATLKLEAMSVDNLLELRSEVDRYLIQHRKDLEEQLSQISGHVKTSRVKTVHNGTGRSSPAKGIKVKPKYRGPKGETWAGRGLHPTWLAALLKRGHKLEQYAIGGSKRVAAAKQAAKKVKTMSKAKRTKKPRRGR